MPNTPPPSLLTSAFVFLYVFASSTTLELVEPLYCAFSFVPLLKYFFVFLLINNLRKKKFSKTNKPLRTITLKLQGINTSLNILEQYHLTIHCIIRTSTQAFRGAQIKFHTHPKVSRITSDTRHASRPPLCDGAAGIMPFQYVIVTLTSLLTYCVFYFFLY